MFVDMPQTKRKMTPRRELEFEGHTTIDTLRKQSRIRNTQTIHKNERTKSHAEKPTNQAGNGMATRARNATMPPKKRGGE